MSHYYNPAKIVEGASRETAATNPLPKWSRRVMWLHNGLRSLAVDVTDPGEFDYFYAQYAKGLWIDIALYRFDSSISSQFEQSA